ncbi:MAG: pitrilysin family protein, partial [Roseiarcus sp.]
MQKHLAVSSSHSAVNVDVVTSPRGLKFWLVPSHAVPVVSLEFAMRGGVAQDPAEKAGLGALMSGLLDEGAGELDSQAFHRALDEIAVEMSFHCDRDHWSGRMRTLTKNLDRAAELLRLAVNAPRFDQEPFERVREHMNARLRHDANDPATLASRSWKAKSFPDHPYGQPADGTLETLARIERADLVKAAKRGIARDQLLIAVVGAIEEKEAAALVDKAFADLPAKGDLKPIPAAAFKGLGAIDRIDLDVPQSTIRFGRPALKRDDPDFIPSVVAAHVLGGSGSMTSRLFREVREKRGLAYTVFGTFYSLEQGAYFYGGTTTKNERARESFDV